jgi:hypothetical protein
MLLSKTIPTSVAVVEEAAVVVLAHWAHTLITEAVAEAVDEQAYKTQAEVLDTMQEVLEHLAVQVVVVLVW